MKFASKHDAQMFLTEIGRIDLIREVDQDFKPTDDMLEIFVKIRRTLVPGLRNFRKSQVSKEQWRKNRYKLLKGIKRFHRSTKGKRMHRAIGRFLATRDSSLGSFKRKANEYLEIHDVCEILKALTSVKTHNYIEFEYYHTVDEEVLYQIFTEELLPAIDRMEKALISTKGTITKEDLDFLTRIVEPNALFHELSEVFGASYDDIKKYFDHILESMNEDAVGTYLDCLNKTKKAFTKEEE